MIGIIWGRNYKLTFFIASIIREEYAVPALK